MPNYRKNNKCSVCPINCKLKIGQTGHCHSRILTQDGISPLNYGYLTDIVVDTIEKKPIYHYKPNSKVLSVGQNGCQLVCKFCENFSISQAKVSSNGKYYSPKNLVELAKSEGCSGIAFTYNEPLIRYEYVVDVAKKAHKNGLFILTKTNGYLSPSLFKVVSKSIDAINIDWKGNKSRLKGICGINKDVDAINENIKFLLGKKKIHLEISVPVYSDYRIEEIDELKEILASHQNIPIHLLKIFPANKMTNVPATSDKLLYQVKDRLKEMFPFVYIEGVYTDENLSDKIETRNKHFNETS